MTAKTLRKLTQKAFAGFMAVWLSGVVFLLCCHATPMPEMDSCPLVRMGAHCDKADKERETEKVTSGTNETGIDCCAFIPAFFDKTRTVDTNQQVAVAPPATTALEPRVVVIRSNHYPVRIRPSIVLVKNDTFLKNRTFRI
jgi:hypothetical protein